MDSLLEIMALGSVVTFAALVALATLVGVLAEERDIERLDTQLGPVRWTEGNILRKRQ